MGCDIEKWAKVMPLCEPMSLPLKATAHGVIAHECTNKGRTLLFDLVMKYIDAERLKTEIEALKRRKGFLPLGKAEITEAYMARGVQFTCDDIVNLIQSLQQEQPEVDLEKEMDRFFEKMPVMEYENIFEETYHMIALHFYELGLNARKEESHE